MDTGQAMLCKLHGHQKGLQRQISYKKNHVKGEHQQWANHKKVTRVP